MSHEELVDQLSDWIEANVIAEQLVETMSEVASPEKMTLDNAKAVYYDFLLNELSDGLRRSASHVGE